MELGASLKKKAVSLGAAYFGIAGLQQAVRGQITPNERKLIKEYPLAVSFGVPLSPSVVDLIGQPQDANCVRNYWYHVYQAVNPVLNDIEMQLVGMITGAGYSALPIPPSQTVDNEHLYGFFSHKLAASLAGHGWIGKNCLLITPDRGPRVRWGTILTDAKLLPGQPLPGKGCGECRKCVDICPSGAFSGRSFEYSEPREMRMDAHKCWQYYKAQEKAIGVTACGLCVYICPFGTKAGKGVKHGHRRSNR